MRSGVFLLCWQWWNLEPERLAEVLPLLCDPNLEKLRRYLRQLLGYSITNS